MRAAVCLYITVKIRSVFLRERNSPAIGEFIGPTLVNEAH